VNLDAVKDAVARLEALRPAPPPADASPAERFAYAFVQAVMAQAVVRESPLVDRLTVLAPSMGDRGAILYPVGGRADFDALLEEINARGRR
jgi:hypothetical protein